VSLDRLREDDVQRLGLGVLRDFPVGFAPLAQAPGKLLGMTPEHHQAVGLEAVGEVGLEADVLAPVEVAGDRVQVRHGRVALGVVAGR